MFYLLQDCYIATPKEIETASYNYFVVGSTVLFDPFVGVPKIIHITYVTSNDTN